MRQSLLLVLAASALAADADAQPRREPLIDLARLRDVEWDVVPIVTLDSSKNKDTLAVRRVVRAFHLAPGRVVYEAQTTDGNDWAIFSWVDGTTRRLALHDREFTEPDGRKKRIYDRFWHHGGPGAYAASVTVEKRTPMPNYVYVTDGITWRPVIRDGDTITVAGQPMVVDAAGVRGVNPDGSVLIGSSFKSPKTMGLLAARDGRFQPLLMKSDTIPTVREFETAYTLWQVLGMWSGLKTFEPTPDGYLALMRTHEGGRTYLDRVVVKSGNAAPRVITQTDTFSMRKNQGDSIMFAAMSPTGDVILQRKTTIGVVPRDGQWKPLVEKDSVGDNFALTDVEWLDDNSSRALLSVSLVAYSGGGVTMSMFPQVFYYDGTRATQVLRDELPRAKIFSNMRPSSPLRRVPGFKGAVVDLGSSPAAGAQRAWHFDPERGTFAPAPAFRTKSGSVGIENVIGWNNGNEAVVKWNGGLALVRRPAA